MAQHSGGIRRPRKSYLISLLLFPSYARPRTHIHTHTHFSLTLLLHPYFYLLVSFPLSLSLSYLRLPHLLSSSFHFFPPPISRILQRFYPLLYPSSLFVSPSILHARTRNSLSRSRSRSLCFHFLIHTRESTQHPRSIHATKHALSCSLFFAPFQHFFFFFLLHSVLFVRRSERLYIFTGILLVVVYSPPSRGNVSSSHHVYLFLFFSFFFSPFFFLFLFVPSPFSIFCFI